MPSIICDIPNQSEDRILRGGLSYYGRPVSFRNLNSLRSVLRRLARCTFGFIRTVTNCVGLFESTFSVFRGLAENLTSMPEILNLSTGRRLGNGIPDN